MQKFSEYVKLKREALGISQTELATRLYGTKRRNYIQEIESGSRSVSVKTMDYILEFFKAEFQITE